MTGPVIGHVTDAVANSPTAPFSGVHSEITALKLYEGLSAATFAAATGCTTTGTTVPSSG